MLCLLIRHANMNMHVYAHVCTILQLSNCNCRLQLSKLADCSCKVSFVFIHLPFFLSLSLPPSLSFYSIDVNVLPSNRNRQQIQLCLLLKTSLYTHGLIQSKWTAIPTILLRQVTRLWQTVLTWPKSSFKRWESLQEVIFTRLLVTSPPPLLPRNWLTGAHLSILI